MNGEQQRQIQESRERIIEYEDKVRLVEMKSQMSGSVRGACAFFNQVTFAGGGGMIF